MDSVLEGVMQTELDLSWRRAYSANLTEIAVGYPVVGISVAGDVKDVEEIGAEANYLFAPHVKVLEQRSIDLSVARGTLGVDGRSAERRQPAIVSDAIGTGSIVGTGAANGRWIGSPPAIDGTVAHDQLSVLIGARLAITICIAVVGTVDGDGESRIKKRRG